MVDSQQNVVIALEDNEAYAKQYNVGSTLDDQNYLINTIVNTKLFQEIKLNIQQDLLMISLKGRPDMKGRGEGFENINNIKVDFPGLKFEVVGQKLFCCAAVWEIKAPSEQKRQFIIAYKSGELENIWSSSAQQRTVKMQNFISEIKEALEDDDINYSQKRIEGLTNYATDQISKLEELIQTNVEKSKTNSMEQSQQQNKLRKTQQSHSAVAKQIEVDCSEEAQESLNNIIQNCDIYPEIKKTIQMYLNIISDPNGEAGGSKLSFKKVVNKEEVDWDYQGNYELYCSLAIWQLKSPSAQKKIFLIGYITGLIEGVREATEKQIQEKMDIFMNNVQEALQKENVDIPYQRIQLTKKRFTEQAISELKKK